MRKLLEGERVFYVDGGSLVANSWVGKKATVKMVGEARVALIFDWQVEEDGGERGPANVRRSNVQPLTEEEARMEVTEVREALLSVMKARGSKAGGK